MARGYSKLVNYEVVDRAASNQLPINEGKTKAMLITGKRLPSKINEEMTKETELELVPSAKLVGLEIDSELSFPSPAEKLNFVKSCHSELAY